MKEKKRRERKWVGRGDEEVRRMKKTRKKGEYRVKLILNRCRTGGMGKDKVWSNS